MLRQPGDEPRLGLLAGAGQRGLAGGEQLPGPNQHRLDPLGTVREEGDGTPPGPAIFVDAVEEGGEAVVLGVRHRVELVTVALATAEGQPQPDRPHRIDPVDHVIDAGLLGIAASLAIRHVIAMEGGGQSLVGGGVGQQIASELLTRERGVIDPRVEALHHPVAPGPVVAGGIGLKTVGVGVPGGVEPPHRHPFAKSRRSEQALDLTPPRFGRIVRDKLPDLCGRGGETGQIKAESAELRAR